MAPKSPLVANMAMQPVETIVMKPTAAMPITLSHVCGNPFNLFGSVNPKFYDKICLQCPLCQTD